MSPQMDIALAVGLVALAAWSLLSRDLFTGIVVFMAFGLVMSLVWVRMHAPDVALAEAAIGAGVTGTLFLRALARQPSASGVTAPIRTLTLAMVPLALVLIVALPGGERPSGLAEAMATVLPESGVSNPVLAVLLNQRAYDTLLEVAVIFLALVVTTAVDTGRVRLGSLGPVFYGAVGLFVPALILFSGYLLYIGGDRPGGAFQAGALLGAAGILLRLAGVKQPSAGPGAGVLAGLGLFVFVGVGALGMVAGPGFLEYRGATAKSTILIIESAAALSIGWILTRFFVGADGNGKEGSWPA